MEIINATFLKTLDGSGTSFFDHEEDETKRNTINGTSKLFLHIRYAPKTRPDKLRLLFPVSGGTQPQHLQH